MSSVVSFGTNTAAQRKRVMYFGTSVIYEGMPVCYDDSTINVLGIDTGASNAVSTTTTEGGQNEGKFLRVEDPITDNLGLFAGVVAHGPKVGTTGVATGVWLDIFIPNGAIVPVRAGVYCTTKKTILSVLNGVQYLGHPLSANVGRAVAIAEESYDRSTAGLVLAKLDPNMFLYQTAQDAALEAGVGATIPGASQHLNEVNIKSSHTAGYFTNFMIKTEFNGALTANGGAGIIGYVKLSATLTTNAQKYVRSILGQLDLTAGTIAGNNTHLFGVMGQVNGTPTAYTECSHTAAICGDLSLTVAPTTGNLEVMQLANNGAARLDQMVYMYGNSGASSGGADYIWRFDSLYFDGAVNTPIRDGGTGDTTLDTGGDWKKIRINIGGTAYWMVAMTDPSES